MDNATETKSMNNTAKEHIHYKYFLILTAFYITISITSLVLTYRLVVFGPFVLHGGSVIYPLSYILGDVITEVYGYKLSRQLIWISIICGFLFSFIAIIVIHLPAPGFWHNQKSFIQVLGHSLRFTTGGSIGVFVGSFVNIYIISKTKIYLHGKYFWLRGFFSSTFGEAIQSLIVVPFGFLGVVPLLKVITIMFTAFSFKMIYNLLAIGPANYLANYLKKREGIDIYDFDTKFTPFSFET